MPSSGGAKRGWLGQYESSGRHEGGWLGFSLRFAFQIQPLGVMDDGRNLRAGPKREIASVAPFLRNDSFLSREEHWRYGVTTHCTICHSVTERRPWLHFDEAQCKRYEQRGSSLARKALAYSTSGRCGVTRSDSSVGQMLVDLFKFCAIMVITL